MLQWRTFCGKTTWYYFEIARESNIFQIIAAGNCRFADSLYTLRKVYCFDWFTMPECIIVYFLYPVMHIYFRKWIIEFKYTIGNIIYTWRKSKFFQFGTVGKSGFSHSWNSVRQRDTFKVFTECKRIFAYAANGGRYKNLLQLSAVHKCTFVYNLHSRRNNDSLNIFVVKGIPANAYNIKALYFRRNYKVFFITVIAYDVHSIVFFMRVEHKKLGIVNIFAVMFLLLRIISSGSGYFLHRNSKYRWAEHQCTKQEYQTLFHNKTSCSVFWHIGMFYTYYNFVWWHFYV